MANDEIVKVIKVDTDEAQISMADLRKEISTLRDKLLNLDTTSEEYRQTCEDINAIQGVITSTMNATKQTVEHLEGSYNALSAEMSRLKKEWKATNDVATRDELGKRIAEINSQLKQMDSSIGVFNRNVGSYEQAIENAINKNVSFGDAMRDMQQSTEQTRAKFEAVQKISSGLASGYSALTGVTALLGVENEEFEQTLIKLQSAMAIASGVGGLKDLYEGLNTAKVAFANNITAIKTFIKSLNGVKGALIGTGIGAFVVLLGVVIANWEKISKWLGIAKDAQVDYNQALKDYNNLSKEFETNLSREIELLKLKGATEEDLRLFELSKRDEELNRRKKAMEEAEKAYKSAHGKEKEEAKKHYDELKQDYETYLSEYIHKQNVFNLQTINEQEQAYKEQQEKYKEHLKEMRNLQKDFYDEFADLKMENALYGLNDGEKQTRLTQIEFANQMADAGDLLLKGMITEDAYNQFVEELKKKLYNDVNEINKEVNGDIANSLLDNLSKQLSNISGNAETQMFNAQLNFEESDNPLENIKNMMSLLNEEKNIMTSMYTEQISAIDETLKNTVLSEEQRMLLIDERTQLELKANQQIQSAEKETNELKKQYIKQEKEMRKQAVSATLSTTSNMLGSLASLYEENSNEYKGIMATQAVVDALASANGAYNSLVSTPFVGPYIAPIAAAAALVAGYANVKKILSANENTQLTPQTPTVPNVEVPNIQNVRNIQTNSELEEMNKSHKIYVAETDIEDVRRKIEVAETSSTF